MDGAPAPNERAANFGFVGQFVELPEDVVFTVQYSVHAAMVAVCRLLGVERRIPLLYHGMRHTAVAVDASRALIGSGR